MWRSAHASRPTRLALCAAALTIGGACAHLRGGSGEDYQAVMVAGPEATLRTARTRLEEHGFKVNDAGPTTLVTIPTPIPPRLLDGERRLEGRYWMLHVTAQPQRFTSGTRLRVVGYLLPAATPGERSQKEAIPITSDQRALFAEVQAAGRWIEGKAN